MKFEITKSQVNELAKAIAAHQTAKPAGASAKDVTAAFCENWDTVKPTLELLANVLRVIPAVGLFAGPAISIVIAAGDAAKKALCD